MTEADTCRKYVVPKLHGAGWSDDQIIEQKYFTDGRIVTAGEKHFRKPRSIVYACPYTEENLEKNPTNVHCECTRLLTSFQPLCTVC